MYTVECFVLPGICGRDQGPCGWGGQTEVLRHSACHRVPGTRPPPPHQRLLQPHTPHEACAQLWITCNLHVWIYYLSKKKSYTNCLDIWICVCANLGFELVCKFHISQYPILHHITPPTSFQSSHWLKWRHVTAQYFTILGQLQKIWG